MSYKSSGTNDYNLINHAHLLFQIYTLLRNPEDSLPRQAAGIMIKVTDEERGTIAGLATLPQTLNKEHPDGT